MSEDQPHILIIDDEPIALSNMSHVLEREGYLVTACENGESGLAAMQSTEFDIVLTDLRMPGIDGMDVLRYIRESTPDVPVIMITGTSGLSRLTDFRMSIPSMWLSFSQISRIISAGGSCSIAPMHSSEFAASRTEKPSSRRRGAWSRSYASNDARSANR